VPPAPTASLGIAIDFGQTVINAPGLLRIRIPDPAKANTRERHGCNLVANCRSSLEVDTRQGHFVAK